MKRCPHCGNEIFCLDSNCPHCKKPLKNYFYIPTFLLENFRLFTIIGVIGTMIALIPNLGTQILGANWIADQTSSLPLFLSISIFFGALFITLVFLAVFSLVLQCRENEKILKKITIPRINKIFTIYQGDYQRFILLFCLIPMWIGLILFLIPLMSFIQNIYSWIFAAFVLLVIVPMVAFSYLGWQQAKNIDNISSEMGQYNRITRILLTIIAIECFILAAHFFPLFYGSDHAFSENIKIEPDQQYFSPQISSDKGLRLEITNLSGRELLISRHTWSANYGYFIWVNPTTSRVIVLGNPLVNTTATTIYWTYPNHDIGLNKTPVHIQLHVFKLSDNSEIADSSLYLTWYDTDIVYVNTSYSAS